MRFHAFAPSLRSTVPGKPKILATLSRGPGLKACRKQQEKPRARLFVGKLRRTGECPNIKTCDSSYSGLISVLAQYISLPWTRASFTPYSEYSRFLLHQVIDHPWATNPTIADLGKLEPAASLWGVRLTRTRAHKQNNSRAGNTETLETVWCQSRRQGRPALNEQDVVEEVGGPDGDHQALLIVPSYRSELEADGAVWGEAFNR